LSELGATTRVLLVEDDPDYAVLVRACLAAIGIEARNVIEVRNAVEALALVRTGPFCVLLDLGPDSQAGLGALVEIAGASLQSPVVVLTARSNDRTGLDALAAGAEDYLIKDDLSPHLLGRAIRYAIERNQARLTTQQLRQVELSAAEQQRLERGLLPTPLLHTGAVSCETYYQPGTDDAVLGGDFYDVVQRLDGSIRAVVGDVMGHGPDEAALGVHLRVAWRTLVLSGLPDDQILPTLNRLFAAETAAVAEKRGGLKSGSFVTVCDLTLEPDQPGGRHRLSGFTATVRTAGHPAPLLYAYGHTSYLDVPVGRPLGLGSADTDRWDPLVIGVPAGGSLVMYTDGLLDAYATAEDLGVDELLRAVDSCASGGAATRKWVADLVDKAPQRSPDDTAVVVLSTLAPIS
jgi:serine phosphatase RsbU (regulator of sigma subunit)